MQVESVIQSFSSGESRAGLPDSGSRSAAPALPEADTVIAGHGAGHDALRDIAQAPGPAKVDAKRRAALENELLAKVPEADRAAAKKAIPAILDAAREQGITDPNQIGYLLATAQLESDFGANMTESGHSKAYFNKAYGGDDGNRPGTDDGYIYRGRGYVQTTHEGRYAEMSHRLGLPDVPVLESGKPVLDAKGKPKMQPTLVANPELLTDPAVAARALVIGVKENLYTHNAGDALAKTVPAGHKPGDVDFYHARGIVNGIVDGQATTIRANATTYAEILLGYRHTVLGAPGSK